MTEALPHCDPAHGCITCGDEAVAMRVVSFDAGANLARCTAERGEQEVDTLLVGAVAPGEELLVHAGVALLRLEEGAA